MSSDSQIARIERNRRPIGERPVMMNRSSGEFGPIAPSLEDWSIVVDSSLKEKLITNLETTKTSDADKIRRRTKLTNQFGNSRLSRANKDASYHANKVEATTSLVGEVRSVRVDGAGDTPPDVTDMASDLRQGMLDSEHRARNSKFTVSLLTANLRLENLYQQNLAEVQRTKGWAPVLQTYEDLD